MNTHPPTHTHTHTPTHTHTHNRRRRLFGKLVFYWRSAHTKTCLPHCHKRNHCLGDILMNFAGSLMLITSAGEQWRCVGGSVEVCEGNIITCRLYIKFYVPNNIFEGQAQNHSIASMVLCLGCWKMFNYTPPPFRQWFGDSFNLWIDFLRAYKDTFLMVSCMFILAWEIMTL